MVWSKLMIRERGNWRSGWRAARSGHSAAAPRPGVPDDKFTGMSSHAFGQAKLAGVGATPASATGPMTGWKVSRCATEWTLWTPLASLTIL